jgi:hypothetical protein
MQSIVGPSALAGTRFPAIRGSLGAGTGLADRQIQPSARSAAVLMRVPEAEAIDRLDPLG